MGRPFAISSLIVLVPKLRESLQVQIHGIGQNMEESCFPGTIDSVDNVDALGEHDVYVEPAVDSDRDEAFYELTHVG